LQADTTNPAEPAEREGVPAFAEVVNEHWSAVYRLLFCLSGNTHETEDLTQETFLRALRRPGSFRPGSQLRAWLLRIASNAFFDERRKRKRSRARPLNHDPPGNRPIPGYRLEVAEQSARVHKALEELSELTRLVFHLRVQEDLSFKDIAEMAGTSEQSARWHMHHARTRLLAILGEDF
jgi:RNA polymerase sigma-70 factor, ECF subfamily